MAAGPSAAEAVTEPLACWVVLYKMLLAAPTLALTAPAAAPTPGRELLNAEKADEGGFMRESTLRTRMRERCSETRKAVAGVHWGSGSDLVSGLRLNACEPGACRLVARRACNHTRPVITASKATCGS